MSEESNPPCFQQSKRKTITEKPAHEIHDQHTAPLNEDDLNEEISHVLKTELAAPFHKWVTSEVDPDPANWTDLNDNEMDGMILQKDEVMAKTELWEEMNQDWITLQQQKAVVAEKSDNSADAHSAKRRKKGVPALNRDGTIKVVQADVTGKRSRKIVVNSPADATREVLERKLAPRLSRKLNYKALDSLFSK